MNGKADMILQLASLLEDAIEEGDDSFVVNLDKLRTGLEKQDIPVRWLDRNGAIAELRLLREEIPGESTRLHHAADDAERARRQGQLATMRQREEELVAELWPEGEPQ